MIKHTPFSKHRTYKSRFFRRVGCLLTFILCISLFSHSFVLAGSWDGQGNSSAGGNYGEAVGGFSLESTTATGAIIGYRFSIYDENGDKLGFSVDVDLKTHSKTLLRSYRENKQSHIDLYKSYKAGNVTLTPYSNLSSSTGSNARVLLDSDLDAELPTTPTEMQSWLTPDNARTVAQLCDVDDFNTAKNYIVCEPLFVAELEDDHYAMTIAEYAVYQSTQYGWTSVPSKATENTYSYIMCQLSGYFGRSLYATGTYPFGTSAVVNSYVKNDNWGQASIILPKSNGLFNTAADILTYQVGMGVYTDVIPTYTHTLSHWIKGYKNGEGNNSAKDSYKTQADKFTTLSGASFVMDIDRAVTVPNGYYLNTRFGTYDIESSWGNYQMPYTVPGLSKSATFEYYYYPYTYDITYKLNGGTNSPNNPSTYTVQYGVTFSEPTREGYTFVGWRDTATGKMVTGINPGKTAVTGTPSQIASALASRTIGDQTVEAIWIASDSTKYTVNHHQMNVDGNGYTLNETEIKTGTSGASLTLANLAKSYEGFTYKEGKVDGVVQTTTTILADGSRVIDLYYTRNQYKVILNEGTGIDSVSGAGTYYYGASVTIDAVVSSGYTWLNWTGTHNTSTQRYTFTMPANDVEDTANATKNAATTASYTVNHYQMNTSGNYPSSPTETETKTGNIGATVTLADLAKSYSGFEYSYGQANSGYNGRMTTVTSTTILEDGSRIINLYYTRNQYEVILHEGTGIDSVSGAGTYYYGASVTIDAVVSSGYTWLNWTGTHNTSIQRYTFTMPANDVEDTANATKNAATTAFYTVNHYQMNTSGNYPSSPTETETKTGNIGASVTLADLAKSYTGFAYDYGQANSGLWGRMQTVTSTTILEDGSRIINLYYTRNQYEVVLNKGTGIESVSGAGTYYFGASVVIDATVSSGYTWSKWSGTHNTTEQKYSFTMPANDVEDTANATKNAATTASYTVNHYQMNTSGNYPSSPTETETKTGNIGASVTLADLAKSYSGFEYSYGQANSGYNGRMTTVTSTTILEDGSRVINLYYTRNQYEVVLNKGAGIDSVFGAGKYYHGAPVNIDATVSSGYTWKNWTGTHNTSVQKYTFTMPMSNVEDTANATKETAEYTVNHYQMDLSGNYPASPAETDLVTGKAGSSVTLADLAKPYSGFTYAYGQANTGWFGRMQTVTTATILEDGSRIINLYYSRNQYEVVLNKGTGIDSVSGAGTYYFGASVVIDATVSSGYTWSNWSGTHDTTEQKYSFTMPDADVTDTANATTIAESTTYSITYDLDGGHLANGKTNPSTYTVETETFTLNNPTKTGYTFKGWTGSNGTTPEITVTVAKGSTGDKSFTANWTPITYTVQYDGNGATGGSTPSSTHMFDEEKNLTANGFTKTDHTFIAWNTQPDGSGVAYVDEALVKNLASTAGETIVLYAQWGADGPPVITAIDRWFTLEEAQTGRITFSELMSTADAKDSYVGSYTDFDAGEGTFTIVDFSAEEFISFTGTGSVTVTYFAEDFGHNKVYKTVTVYIVDANEDLPSGFGNDDRQKFKIRFISREYFVDEFGNSVDELLGGFNPNSKWRTNSSYYNKIVSVLSNNKIAGSWSIAPLYSFVIDSDTYMMMHEFVEEYGYGAALTEFFDAFLD